MVETIKNAWKIEELRKKILFTLFIIVLFRVGAAIPVPFIDGAALKALMEPVTSASSNNILGYLNMMSGGSFERATIFAMSITPYINASIIMQLLAVVFPSLAELSKEGEAGRKKMTRYTRYLAVGLAVLQGMAFYFYLRNSGAVAYAKGLSGVFAALVIIASFSAGSMLVVWLGEQINQYGIGNGISMMIFAGIVAGLPQIIGAFVSYFSLATLGGAATKYYFFVPLVAALFLALIWVIVFMNDAERRIPVQYAKRVVGRKVYGGQSTHMPVKVNMSGVMPVIFASSILMIPGTIEMFANPAKDSFWGKFFAALSPTGWVYSILYFILIIAFAYFYTAIQYNPQEMANNLRKNNGGIPGIRPGKPTADYLAKIVGKITLIGALFLAFIALMPTVSAAVTGMNISMGGTSIIIVVGVALETVRQIESQMLMRHYKGFLQ